jgi:hypothetical protein
MNWYLREKFAAGAGDGVRALKVSCTRDAFAVPRLSIKDVKVLVLLNLARTRPLLASRRYSVSRWLKDRVRIVRWR